MSEKKFINGLWFNLPLEKAPDFVKGSISISKESFMEWLKEAETNEKGYIKIDLKISKENKPYAELNTWKTEDKPKPKEEDVIQIDEDDSNIPF